MPLPVHVPPGQYEGIDQGIDFSSPAGTFGYALAAGRITRISPRGSWGGGTGAGVYETLDQPIQSPTSGRTYDQIYYAEEDPAPGIGLGTRIWPGMPVISFSAVQSEFGFASGDSPAGHLDSSCCNSSVRTCCWTPEGQDFHDWAFGISGGGKLPAPPAPSTPAPGGGAAPAPGGGPTPPAHHCCLPFPPIPGVPKIGVACDGAYCQNIGNCVDCDSGKTVSPTVPKIITGAGHGIVCGVPCFGIATGTDSTGAPSSSICDGGCWVRLLEIVGGAILLLVGIILLGRQLGAPTAFTVKGLPGAG